MENIYKKLLTLYVPRSFTVHPNFTLRPAGTVIFPISSTNSGSGTVDTEKKKNVRLQKTFNRRAFKNWIF